MQARDLLQNKRFIAIVGMLGSNQAGEAGNAALMASKMLKDAGLTWAEILRAAESGGGSDPYHQATLQRLYAAQRAQEASETRARKAEALLREERAAHFKTMEQLRIANLAIAGMKERLKDFEKPDPSKFKGFTFSHAEPAAFNGHVPYATIEPFLRALVDDAWDDLSEWEQGFFRDFVEKKRGIKSEKQWNIFKRIADKFDLPLDAT